MTLESLKNPSIRASAMATTPMNKIAEPEDVTGTIAYLASWKLSGHITGEIITMYDLRKMYLTLAREEWKVVNSMPQKSSNRNHCGTALSSMCM
jgi:NAD(P)-dependent dehydrogenase (short-subunit alcohol dehydrogenase family)